MNENAQIPDNNAPSENPKPSTCSVRVENNWVDAIRYICAAIIFVGLFFAVAWTIRGIAESCAKSDASIWSNRQIQKP